MTAMQRTSAAVGTSIFFVLAPGTVAGLIPWALTGWHPHHTQASAWIPFRVLGAALIAAALPVLVAAFVRFAKEGIGTPAPIAPTEHLVVGGLYRYVRNPIYLAVTALIVGQALLLAQPALLWYAAIFFTAMVAFVYGYEQPTLSERFGAEYDQYRHAVPGWWPRRRPWQPPIDRRRPRPTPDL
jgi:protein-S-isoprenylcysteine O-methyltransferase Ste14